MPVKLNFQIPDGIKPGKPSRIKFKLDQNIDDHQSFKMNGNFDLVLALYQTSGRIKGILAAFSQLPIAGTLTIIATSTEYSFEGELTAYSQAANKWQEKILSMVDSAIYSMRRECGDVLTKFCITLVQTCTWKIETN